MSGISPNTVIQTTWRVPFRVNGQHNFRISFESVESTWVSFIVDGQTGTLSHIEDFTPATQIPNWYGTTPFARWSITIDSRHTVELDGSTLISQTWETNAPSLETFLHTFSPQVICALWLGKFGYTILTP